MDIGFAQQFAEEWVAGWNSHDLDRIMRHYDVDVVFRSPLAAKIVDAPDGTVVGKRALRAYWAEGLRQQPDLRFEVIGVYAGVDTVVINYRNHRAQLVNEVLAFAPNDLVTAGHATYGPLS